MTSRIVLLIAFVVGSAVLLSNARSIPWPQEQDSKQEKPKDDKAKEEKAREEKEQKEKEKALKRAALEREYPIAKEKLARAQKDLADQTVDTDAANAKLQKELQLARMKLETFEKREMPSKIAKAQLDLQFSRDNVDESKEELEQLELMYKEQDLADKTREIVIKRAKRQLDRMQQRLALQEGEVSVLTERTLPAEHQKIQLEVDEKEREIARADRNAQKTVMEKRIALMSAEADIKRIETEMASLKGDAK